MPGKWWPMSLLPPFLVGDRLHCSRPLIVTSGCVLFEVLPVRSSVLGVCDALGRAFLRHDQALQTNFGTSPCQNHCGGCVFVFFVFFGFFWFFLITPFPFAVPEVQRDRSGSTCTAVLVSPTHIFFANCGDSRAVLSRNTL
jgi:hypothetical protein